ncbi:MAG TPA: hypothetical protein VF077_04960 [Nitrospiraceae bacterium]
MKRNANLHSGAEPANGRDLADIAPGGGDEGDGFDPKEAPEGYDPYDHETSLEARKTTPSSYKP